MNNSEIKTQGINHKKLRPIIKKLKERIKGSKIITRIFNNGEIKKYKSESFFNWRCIF